MSAKCVHLYVFLITFPFLQSGDVFILVTPRSNITTKESKTITISSLRSLQGNHGTSRSDHVVSIDFLINI